MSASGTTLGQKEPGALLEKIEYIKNALSQFVATQGSNSKLFTLDGDELKKAGQQFFSPNSTICLFCDKSFHGNPAVRTDANGVVVDTLKPNSTGGIDTVPRRF